MEIHRFIKFSFKGNLRLVLFGGFFIPYIKNIFAFQNYYYLCVLTFKNLIIMSKEFQWTDKLVLEFTKHIILFWDKPTQKRIEAFKEFKQPKT